MSACLSVVIPTWNGRALLDRYLPSVAAELERWRQAAGAGAELVIADDGSSDATASWLARAHPAARLVRSETNRGFAYAANAGIEAARGEIVILLNNDVEVTPGSFNPVPAWFADPALFGVTLRGLDLPALTFSTGGKLGRWRRGFWETWRNYDVVNPAAGPGPGGSGSPPRWPSFALVGGFCALRRAMFLELGGFDPLFAPYYWEDIDLSYRARKRGWQIGYEPRATVHHAVSATIRRHRTPWRRRVVIHRNRLLFHAKNLDARTLRRHRLWRRLLLLQLALRGDFAYHAGYLAAWRLRAQVREFRRREQLTWRRRDEELALAEPRGSIALA